MPCSISASTWFAVTTRGLEIILPLPSLSSAVISRFRNFVAALLNSMSENCPACAPVSVGVAGRLIMLACGKLGIGLVSMLVLVAAFTFARPVAVETGDVTPPPTLNRGRPPKN